MIHNERIKLLATASSNLGLAFIIGGFVTRLIAEQITSETMLRSVAWLVAGMALHIFAQAMLGRMKA